MYEINKCSYSETESIVFLIEIDLSEIAAKDGLSSKFPKATDLCISKITASKIIAVGMSWNKQSLIPQHVIYRKMKKKKSLITSTSIQGNVMFVRS